MHALFDALPRSFRHQRHHLRDACLQALHRRGTVDVLHQPHLQIAVAASLYRTQLFSSRIAFVQFPLGLRMRPASPCGTA